MRLSPFAKKKAEDLFLSKRSESHVPFSFCQEEGFPFSFCQEEKFPFSFCQEEGFSSSFCQEEGSLEAKRGCFPKCSMLTPFCQEYFSMHCHILLSRCVLAPSAKGIPQGNGFLFAEVFIFQPSFDDPNDFPVLHCSLSADLDYQVKLLASLIFFVGSWLQ